MTTRLVQFLSLVLLLPVNAPAQEGSNAPSPTIKVTTHLVQVDVVVTNGKGEPVPGLTLDDFTILEDGKPQKLASFTAHGTGTGASSSAAEKARSLPPGVFSNRGVKNDEGAITIILLDALNTPMLDQAYTREQMLKYVKTQHQSAQRTAILGLTNNLLLLQDLTDDPKLLTAAIAKRAPAYSALLNDPDLDRMEIRNAPPQVVQSLERFEQELTAQRTDMRVQTTFAAMQLIARAYGGIPGRKNLIWVSAAFPLMLAPDQINSLSSRYYGEELRRTASMLERAQIAVYPVDARGLMGPAGATFTGRDRGGSLMSGPELSTELANRANLLTSSHGAMQEIAEQTGGRAYYNRNDIDRAVALAIADGSSYYALSYYPDNKDWNGKYRKISVKVSREGVRLRHRRGYLASDLTRSKEPRGQGKREIEAALADPILQTMIGLEGAVISTNERAGVASSPQAAASSVSSGKRTVRVGFKVDPLGVSFEDTQDGLHSCSLELVAAAFDESSKIVGQISETLEGKLKPETYNRLMQQGFVFNTNLELPSRFTRLRLLVRDNRTGLIGTLDIPYTATN